ncbi:MAG: methylenetetrahydrofolate reductase C-terminal domain-containing protein [Desulforhopalus sp.]
MITAERKPLEELIEYIKPFKRILLLGCNECVTVCAAGGRKEVGLLASGLQMAMLKNGSNIEIRQHTLERQCDPEYVEELVPMIDSAEAIMSMACGCGVQQLAMRFKDKPVFPAVNTKFMGASERQGVWAERCQGCGNCLLGATGGICPIARCAKQLMNGPCGGSTGGSCEISEEVDCAWQLIWDRLKALGLQDRYLDIVPAKDWRTGGGSGPRKIIREDLAE